MKWTVWHALAILWRRLKGSWWRCGAIVFCCYFHSHQCCFCCYGCGGGGQCWSSCGGFSKVLGGGAGDTTLLPCLSSQLPAPLISSQSSSSSLYQAIRCMFGEKKGSLKKIGEKLAPHLHLPDQLIFLMWMSLAYLTLATTSLLMPPSFDWLKMILINMSCTIFKYFFWCTKVNHLNDKICALFPLMLFGWDQIWIVMSQHATSKQPNMWQKEWLWTQ